MKKPLILLFLSIGILLVFSSSQDMSFEGLFYDKYMNQKYDIIELNEMYKGIPTQYSFAGKTIDTTHVLQEEHAFVDPWDNTVNLGDIFITVDGEEIAKLVSFPIEQLKSGLTVEGLNQYGNFVSYWRIFDKELEQESFAVVLQTTREIINGNIEGYIPKEEQDYKLITINENGEVDTEDFSFKNGSKLQLELLPTMDELEVYPEIFIYFYPHITFLIGILMVIVTLVLLALSLFVRNKEPISTFK